MTRFADTYFYLAVLNPSDRTHGRAVQLSRQLTGGGRRRRSRDSFAS